MSSRTSKVLLVVAFLALAALGGVLGVIALGRRAARKEALSAIEIAEKEDPQRPGGGKVLLERSASALEMAPDLADAHAFRSFALAYSGDLAGAKSELDDAGSGERAQRARAWVAYLEDEPLGRVLATLPSNDITAGDRSTFTIFESHAPTLATLVRGPVQSGWDNPIARTTAEAELDSIQATHPGTLVYYRAHLVRAAAAFAALKDEEAREQLEPLLVSSPRVRGWARDLEERVAAADARRSIVLAPLFADRVFTHLLPALCWSETYLARRDLDRAALLDDAEARARGTKRAFRLAAIVHAREDALPGVLRPLLHALYQSRETSGDLLRELSQKRPELASAVALALSPDAPPTPGDVTAAFAFFALDGTSDQARALCVQAHRAFLLDRPWAARGDLEKLLETRALSISQFHLAEARAKEDPVGALAALSLMPHADSSGYLSVTALAELVGRRLPRERDALIAALAARGLDAKQVARALELHDRTAASDSSQ